jgi:plasmid stabilization system protein ParE
MLTMTDIHGLISSLPPEDLAVLQERGPDQRLDRDRDMLDAIDRAAGGPGDGRGYYVVRGSLIPLERRNYYLREDVADAIFAPSTLEGATGSDA